MNERDWLQLYFERSDSLQSLWTLYVVVVGGMLAFSSIRKEPHRLTTALVTVLFGCFAYKNLGAIHDITMQRFAVLESLRIAAQPGSGGVLATLQPPAYDGVRTFHVVADVLTVLTLWAMELRRKQKA